MKNYVYTVFHICLILLILTCNSYFESAAPDSLAVALDIMKLSDTVETLNAGGNENCNQACNVDTDTHDEVDDESEGDCNETCNEDTEPPDDEGAGDSEVDCNVAGTVSYFTVSKFDASYFNDNALTANESVDLPAINYAWSAFHGIPSQDFSASWTGEITVTGASNQIIDINFDISWSDVTLSIDNAEVMNWSNSNKSIAYEFTPGTHSIAIDYANNWNTVGFNVSFTDTEKYSFENAADLIQPMIEPEDTIVYVGTYEAGDTYNKIHVTLNEHPASIFLFVSSYNAVHWTICNPYSVDIKGIVYSSYGPRSVIYTDGNIPAFEVNGMRYGYDDFSNPIADITTLSGRAPDHLYGEYSLESVSISIP